MAVEVGKDYVFAPNMTYHGTAGIGDGCLLGTKNLVLMLPLKTLAGAGNTITTSTFTLGGESPAAVIANFLAEPALDREALETVMVELKKKFADGVLGDLREVGRLKVTAGWFSRGIYWNEKEAGLGGWSGYPLKGKAVAQAFVDFYADHPKLVKKK